MANWTEENADAFAHKMAFDFIAQVEKKLETLPLSQMELARKLRVSEGAVSKVLNNPQNLTLKTIAKYARALGIKAAIVAYDDNDPNNDNGLIGSDIFTTCWAHAGKPRDVWSVEATLLQQSATKAFIRWDNYGPSALFNTGYCNFVTSTYSPLPGQPLFIAWKPDTPNVEKSTVAIENIGDHTHA